MLVSGMRFSQFAFIALIVLAVSRGSFTNAQDTPPKHIVSLPPSSVAIPIATQDFSSLVEEYGFNRASSLPTSVPLPGTKFAVDILKRALPKVEIRAHTNLTIVTPSADVQPPTAGVPSAHSTTIETPASVACIYKVVAVTNPSCNPNEVFTLPTGGSRAIAVVIAYHAPNAETDLAAFSSHFKLPVPSTKEKTFDQEAAPATGNCESTPMPGWLWEASMDIEWAHAMAPSAKIILVEAATNCMDDLASAISLASKLVAKEGGGEVSMSWAYPETPGLYAYDKYFIIPGIVYVGASGDAKGVEYPASSDFVVSVGGTSIVRSGTNFTGETVWASEGAGSSTAGLPTYQKKVSKIVGRTRGVVDIAAIADLEAGGVWVYSKDYPQTNQNWINLGGTSAATPIISGIINSAGGFAKTSTDQLTTIYSNLGSKSFTDIVTGKCGTRGYSAAIGWDFCSGVGSPLGLRGL